MEDRAWIFNHLDYNPETGEFVWMKGRQGVKIGDKAGTVVTGGYIAITIDGKRFMAHRLAWLYCVRRWPLYGIDHLNGNRADNRIVNLQDVPQVVNMEHRVQGPFKLSDLPVGVDLNNGAYRARKRFGTVRLAKGGFLTPEAALECIEKWTAEYKEKQRLDHDIDG